MKNQKTKALKELIIQKIQAIHDKKKLKTLLVKINNLITLNNNNTKEDIKMKIYHNPRCSKSRQTLQLIEQKGTTPTIIKYLEDYPTKDELIDILKKLGIPASQLIRKGEAIYKEEYKGKILNENQWIEAMVKYPKLIERPIVVLGDKAVLGRPPENVLNLFK